MICSSTNCRTISVMAFWSSVFSEYGGVASAMRCRYLSSASGEARRIPALWSGGARNPHDDDRRVGRRRGGGRDPLDGDPGGGGARRRRGGAGGGATAGRRGPAGLADGLLGRRGAATADLDRHGVGRRRGRRAGGRRH